MQPFAFISIVLAATQLAFAAPTPTTDLSSYEYQGSDLYDIVAASSLQVRSPMTNAERLARGFPPAPPKHRGGGKRQGSSPVPQITKRGIIQVTNTANGAVLGFISQNPLSGALYRYEAPEANAQVFTFNVPVGATSVSGVDFTPVNGGAGFSLTGLVQGRDDTNSNIGPGSFHYLYISGTNQTPSGSTPQTVGNSYTQVTGTSRTSESAVWNVDLVSGAVTLQWVNEDGTLPATFLFTQSTALYAGGDQAAFNARYPAPVTSVSYQFLERP